MFYCITYTPWSEDEGTWPTVVLSDLDEKGVADVLRYLADFNFRHGWAVWDATIGTMDGAYVGNPSYHTFRSASENLRLSPV